MIIRLQSKGNITGSIISEILDEYAEITNDLCRSLQRNLKWFMESRQMLDDSDVSDLLKSFEVNKSFEGLRTIEQQMEALKSSTEYIESKEIPLGTRINNIIDKKTGTFVPTKIVETCQYVPIIDFLLMVLRNTEIRNAIEAEKESSNGILASFVDGQHFKNHPFFQKYKHAIRIQLYYDELEITNPLGSKTCIRKLGDFYYTIQNLPCNMNSELNSIHVLLLCCHVDIKKYTMNKILGPFLKDLAKLESDEGVPIFLGEEKYTLRASIAAFCGHGLAIHEVFNFLSPSCTYFVECVFILEKIYITEVQTWNNKGL